MLKLIIKNSALTVTEKWSNRFEIVVPIYVGIFVTISSFLIKLFLALLIVLNADNKLLCLVLFMMIIWNYNFNKYQFYGSIFSRINIFLFLKIIYEIGYAIIAIIILSASSINLFFITLFLSGILLLCMDKFKNNEKKNIGLFILLMVPYLTVIVTISSISIKNMILSIILMMGLLINFLLEKNRIDKYISITILQIAVVEIICLGYYQLFYLGNFKLPELFIGQEKALLISSIMALTNFCANSWLPENEYNFYFFKANLKGLKINEMINGVNYYNFILLNLMAHILILFYLDLNIYLSILILLSMIIISITMKAMIKFSYLKIDRKFIFLKDINEFAACIYVVFSFFWLILLPLILTINDYTKFDLNLNLFFVLVAIYLITMLILLIYIVQRIDGEC